MRQPWIKQADLRSELGHSILASYPSALATRGNLKPNI